MQLQVSYEWCIEFYTDDEYEDITELNFSNTDELNFDADDFAAPEGNRARLCLIRKRGNDGEGEIDRCCAYVQEGKLPEKFEHLHSYKPNVLIPKRYHKQLYNYLTKL